jgi:outer membrane protein, heavy metal efflux system
MRVSATALILIMLAPLGCVRLRPGAGFEDVRRSLSSRTAAPVTWRHNAPAEAAQFEAHLRELLASELTPERAVEIALFNSPALQATYERLGIAQADLVQAGLFPNPVLHASVRFGVAGPGPGAELSLLQDFIRMLEVPLRKRVAAAEFEAAKLDVAHEVIDLAANVKAAFYTLQGAEQMLELRQTVARATELSADIASRQHEVGNITDLDLGNERALAEEAKLDLARAEVDVLADREELNTLLGLWGPNTAWKIAPRLPALPTEEMPRHGLESMAVSQRLDLAAARQAVEVQARSLGLARVTALFPDGVFGGEAEREPDGEWTAGPAIEFSVPVFDQGQAAVARAVAELRERQRRYAALAIHIRSQARRADTRMESARRRAAYYEKIVLPLRHQNVAQAQRQYNGMQIGVFQLLQAKRDEIEAGRNYVETLNEYWLARTELERAVGGDLPAGPTPPSATPGTTTGEPSEQPHHMHHGGH